MDPVPPVMISPECWSAVLRHRPAFTLIFRVIWLASLLSFLRDIMLQIISCPMREALLVFHLWKWRAQRVDLFKVGCG